MFRLVKAVADDMLRALLRRIDAGLDPAELRLFSGRPPRGIDVPTQIEPIGIIELLRPAGRITGASLDLRFSGDAVARRSGRVQWARLVNGVGEVVFDCDAGTEGAALELNYSEYIEGGPIVVRRLIIVQPTQET